MTVSSMLQLDLNTGNIQEIQLNEYKSLYIYFNALTGLNKSAHIYGVVYLPSDSALKLLGESESNETN